MPHSVLFCWSMNNLKIFITYFFFSSNIPLEPEQRREQVEKKSVINICISTVGGVCAMILTFGLALCLINLGGLVKRIHWNFCSAHTAHKPTQNDNKFAKQFNSNFLHGSFFSVALASLSVRACVCMYVFFSVPAMLSNLIYL